MIPMPQTLRSVVSPTGSPWPQHKLKMGAPSFCAAKGWDEVCLESFQVGTVFTHPFPTDGKGWGTHIKKLIRDEKVRHPPGWATSRFVEVSDVVLWGQADI